MKVPATMTSPKIKFVGWTLKVIIFGVFGLLVLSEGEASGGVSASTTGSNSPASPAVNLSGTTSGKNSPLTEAAPGAIVGNDNVRMTATLTGTNSTIILANHSTVNNNVTYNVFSLIAGQTNFFNETNVYNETNYVTKIGELRGKDWKPPLLSTDCDMFSITYGDSSYSTRVLAGKLDFMAGWGTDTNGHRAMMPLATAHLIDGRIYIDVAIPGRYPFGPFELFGNKIIGRLPPTWQMNYDEDALEIINGDEIPVCQIIYARPEVVQVFGCFGNRYNEIQIQTPNGEMRALSPEDYYYSEKFDPSTMGLRRVFKYPFWAYPGQRLPDSEMPLDCIEGTHVTREGLEKLFPFGYAVIYYAQNAITSYELTTNGLMEWDLDIRKVKIQPDFYKGQVSWELPNVSGVSNGGRMHMDIGEIQITSPFKEGVITRAPFLFINKPVPYVGTLNDDQRNPVFVVGYRITTQNEGN